MKRKFYVLLLFVLSVTSAFAGYINGTLIHGGQTRKYVVYIPAIYSTQNIKVPLLVGLHGNGDNAANFSQICMSSAIADTANYIVVYPEALPDPILTTNAWHSGAGFSNPLPYEVNSAVDDVGFINKLMDTMIARYQIDTNRMYVFGFSFGGFMTNKMAASNAKRFAAAACVSGERGNLNTSIPVVPVPYLHFHGLADSVITYNGTGGSFPALGLTPENTTLFWATQNGCSLTPVIDTMPDLANDNLRFIRYTYNHLTNNNKAILYKVVNGEHDWYFRPPNDLDYCQTIWEFFRRYTKASSTPPTASASFTASDTTVCAGNTLTFTSTSTASSGTLDSIRWTISGGTPSTGINSPIVATFSTVGSYIITLKAYKSGNVSTATKTIRVKSLPNANAGADKLLTCVTTSLQLSGSSTTTGATFSWTGAGIVSGSSTATPTVNSTGTYTLTVTYAGCSSTDQTMVSSDFAKPVANAGTDKTITCSTTSVTLGTAAVSGNTYAWNPTTGLNNGAIAQPSAMQSGTFILTVTKTSNGCIAKDTVVVTTDTIRPNVQISAQPICAGQTATLTASGASSYNWGTLGTGNPVITPVLNANTTYSVVGTNAANGCNKTVAYTVIVNPLPATPVITKRNDTLFCSITGTQYKWYLNGALINTTTIPSLKITQNGNYTVVVVSNGCSSLASTVFNATITAVKYSTIDIGFTLYPNPNNGIFQLKIAAASNKNYQLRIFNVEGRMLLEDLLTIKSGDNTKHIDLSGVEKGMYFISIIGDDGMAAKTFIVE